MAANNVSRIVSWNVNGIRSVLVKGILQQFLEEEKPCFMAIQETKAHEDQVIPKFPILGETYPYMYWSSAVKKGYSGVSLFTKHEPIKVESGIGTPSIDDEGRAITLEYDDFFISTVYAPSSRREGIRKELRTVWDEKVVEWAKELQKSKPLILVGDFNVAHTEKDLGDYINYTDSGYTVEEKQAFTDLLETGLVDSFREICPSAGNYTWWSYLTNGRKRNQGWRMDYNLYSKSLNEKLVDSWMYFETPGSDHCPIGVDLKDLFPAKDKE